MYKTEIPDSRSENVLHGTYGKLYDKIYANSQLENLRLTITLLFCHKNFTTISKQSNRSYTTEEPLDQLPLCRIDKRAAYQEQCLHNVLLIGMISFFLVIENFHFFSFSCTHTDPHTSGKQSGVLIGRGDFAGFVSFLQLKLIRLKRENK